jgi:yeast amino acid transporter
MIHMLTFKQNWYQSAITQCAEISAASVVIQYWQGAQNINVAAWITLILVIIICLNIFAVGIYGEAEFCFASIKLVTIFGLLIMSFILIVGGGPNRFAYGFYYWQNPGAIRPYYVYDADRRSLGNFLSFFSTLVNAAFAYGGVEMVAVAAGEAENPRKNIPKAVRRVFWRILFFYVLGTIALGCLVPYNDPNLLSAQADQAAGAAQSPWVIAIRNAGIPVLDSIINFVILTSASSSGNAFLYTGSRYLYALAQNGQAPRFLLKCSKKGVPYYCVCVTASIGLLTYLSCGAGTASVVFGWFQQLTTIANLFTWTSVCAAYLKFYYALKAQGIDRNTLVFKSPFQPYLGWSSLIFFSIIIVFNGFDTFQPFNITNFATAYVGIPIYGLLYLFWKIFKRTKWIPSAEVDLFTGKAALDAADAHWPVVEPKNLLEKFWFWLA